MPLVAFIFPASARCSDHSVLYYPFRYNISAARVSNNGRLHVKLPLKLGPHRNEAIQRANRGIVIAMNQALEVFLNIAEGARIRSATRESARFEVLRQTLLPEWRRITSTIESKSQSSNKAILISSVINGNSTYNYRFANAWK